MFDGNVNMLGRGNWATDNRDICYMLEVHENAILCESLRKVIDG